MAWCRLKGRQAVPVIAIAFIDYIAALMVYLLITPEIKPSGWVTKRNLQAALIVRVGFKLDYLFIHNVY